MGYLKRKLRRSTAGAAARQFRRAAAGHVLPASGAPPVAGFIRLAVGPVGVFQAAYGMRDGNGLAAEARRELSTLLRWFSAELTPHAPADPAAVFWFKADARDHVHRIWDLVRLLQRDGHDVRMWTTRRPGRVVFADAFQVAAVPHRREPVTVKRLPEP